MRAHRYDSGVSLFTRGDGVFVQFTPRCSCGWVAQATYRDAEVAKAAWTAHRESV